MTGPSLEPNLPTHSTESLKNSCRTYSPGESRRRFLISPTSWTADEDFELLFDALAGEFTEIRLRRDPDCPVCGENPTITDYIDYVEFCQGGRTHVA